MEQAQENMEGRGGPEQVNSRRPSNVWKYFTASKDGNGNSIATCNNCQKSYGADGKKHGTAHLKRHIDKCGDGPPQKRPSMQLPDAGNSNLPAQSSSGFNHEECRAELARMITFHGYPSTIVDDECFRSFVRHLNPHFQMPSRDTVEGTCRNRAQDATNQLKETLARCSGHVSLATGTVQTTQGKALYMACQFIGDDWALEKRIMQVFKVVPFPPYHHGALLGAEEVAIELNEGVLEQLSLATTSPTLKDAVIGWGFPDKLFSVAWGEELEKHLEDRNYLQGLRPSVNPNSAVYDVPQVFCVTYTSDVLNSVADKIFRKLDNSYIESCFKALKALPLSQDERDQIISDLGLKHLGRYDQRWFSYYCALELLHKVYADKNATSGEPELNERQIGELLKQSKHKEGKIRELLGLSRFKESQLTELLRRIMGTIYLSIVTISSPSYPTSNLCIQELMKLRAVLQSEAEYASQDVAKAVAYARARGFGSDDVKDVLREAQDIVDEFILDSKEYLPIPVVLDPRFKLGYVKVVFNEVFGSDANDCIEKVIEVAQYLFTEHEYERGDLSGEGTSRMEVRALTAAVRLDVDCSMDEGITELDRYLNESPVQGDDSFDVLQWWNTNTSRYPTVARMARDALAMPASDVLSSEHVSRINSMVSWTYAN